MNVQTVPLAEIRPYWRNPRDNSNAVAAVKESIERYGYNQPIVIDSEYTIVAGHTRYKALKELGHESAEVVIADLPPDKAQEYRIADNATSELAEWDHDKLMQELREVTDPSSLQQFFTDVDIDKLLADITAPPDEGDIEQAEQEHQHRFQGGGGDYAEVTCPECAESFYVDREDILNRTEGDFNTVEFVIPVDARDVWKAAEQKVKARLEREGITPHENRRVWRGQVLEALAAEYLAGPDQ